LVLFSPASAEPDIKRKGKMNGHLMARLSQEYSCQKSLKSDNPS